MSVQENHAEDDERLHEDFKNLQEEWNSFNKSNPRRRRHLRRSSTDPKPTTVNMLKLYNASGSPTNLVPSVEQQISCSPLEGEWKVRTNDLAVIEMLKERRAVIESGKLKGRRLFPDSENVDEMCLSGNEEMYSDDGVVDDDCVSFYGSSSCSAISAEEVESEKGLVSYHTEKENVVVAVNDDRSGEGKWMRLMFSLATVLMLLALGIISLCCFDGFADEDDLYAVYPT